MKLRGKNRHWKQSAMAYIDDLLLADIERKTFMRDCRNIGPANAIVKRILLKNLKMPWKLPEVEFPTGRWVMIDEIDLEPENPDPASLSARRWLLTDETETVRADDERRHCEEVRRDVVSPRVVERSTSS